MSTAHPKAVADWTEYVNGLDTGEKFGAAMNDTSEKGFKAHLAAYTEAMIEQKTAEAVDIANQVKEFTQSTVANMLAEKGIKGDAVGINAALLAGGRPSIGKKSKAPGAALNGTFADVGEFVNAIWHKRQRNGSQESVELDKKLEILNGYSEKIPDAGGFLVPEEFRQELLALELETSIVKPRARVIPMNSASLTFPTVDATSNATSVYGGIVVYRKGEGEEFVESQAKFGKVKLDPTKQTALAYVTNEMIRDGGGALSAFLNGSMPQAMAFYEDVEYLTATGAGEPLGVLHANNPALTVVAKESGQAAATIVFKNALNMYSRLLPGSIGRAVWLASPDTFTEIATMALEVGTGGSAVWIMDAHGAPQLTLLGLPVIRTEKTPGVLGAQGDLSLVDLSFYLIGQRDMMSMDTSEHVRFTSDQTAIRVIQRNDGRPWLQSAITPKNGGPSLSPFVTLAART